MGKALNKNVTVMPITGVVLVVLTTIETVPKVYSYETASTMNTEEVTQTTEEQTLEIKGTVYASKAEESVVIGYNITSTNNVFMPEVAALLTGGTVELDETDGFLSFTPPNVGTKPVKTKFNMDIYSEEVDEGGPTNRYLKLSFEGCIGSTVPLAMEDGTYFSSEMGIQSRPGAGKPPYVASVVTVLPTIS